MSPSGTSPRNHHGDGDRDEREHRQGISPGAAAASGNSPTNSAHYDLYDQRGPSTADDSLWEGEQRDQSNDHEFYNTTTTKSPHDHGRSFEGGVDTYEYMDSVSV